MAACREHAGSRKATEPAADHRHPHAASPLYEPSRSLFVLLRSLDHEPPSNRRTWMTMVVLPSPIWTSARSKLGGAIRPTSLLKP